MTTEKTRTFIGPYGKRRKISGAHITDAEVARRVRMLMRHDLDHEMVCVLARDRIMCLTEELAGARYALALCADALANVRALVAEGAVEGFNYQNLGDWAERLYESQQKTSSAVKVADEILASAPFAES